MEHIWSIYGGRDTHTEGGGERQQRTGGVLHGHTKGDLRHICLVCISPCSLLSIICFNNDSSPLQFNLSNIYQSTLYTSYDNINQVCFTKPTDSLQTDAPKVSSYSTHTQQRQQQHTLVPKTRSPSQFRKLQFHLEGKSITSLFQGDA